MQGVTIVQGIRTRLRLSVLSICCVGTVVGADVVRVLLYVVITELLKVLTCLCTCIVSSAGSRTPPHCAHEIRLQPSLVLLFAMGRATLA